MSMVPANQARTVEGRQIVAAEQAVAELDRLLGDWDEQRAELIADDLGRSPHRRVPKAWPARASADASSAARLAAPISTNTLTAETNALWWSGIGKLIGAGVALTLILALPVSLALNALG